MKVQEPQAFQQLVDQLHETYYSKALEPWYCNFMRELVTISKEAIEQEFSETGTEIPTNFKRATEAFLDSDIYGMMIELTHTRNQHSLITHGDCWLPNFLLHPTEVRLIDFQMVRYGSPALDIALFMYCCTDQALRLAHYDQIVRAYYTSFSELLADLGTDPHTSFPFEALTKELEQFGRFGCGIAVESIPLAMLDERDVPDLDSIQGTSAVPLEQIMKLGKLKDAHQRRRLLDVFRHAYTCGYLK